MKINKNAIGLPMIVDSIPFGKRYNLKGQGLNIINAIDFSGYYEVIISDDVVDHNIINTLNQDADFLGIGKRDNNISICFQGELDNGRTR